MLLYRNEDLVSSGEGSRAVILGHYGNFKLLTYLPRTCSIGSVHEFKGSDQHMDLIDTLDGLRPDRVDVYSTSPELNIVPLELATVSDDRSLLSDLPGQIKGDIVLKNDLPGHEFHLTYAVDSDDYEFMRALTTDPELKHFFGVAISNLPKLDFSGIWSKIIVYVYEKQLFVLAEKQSELVLANVYNYDTAEDVIYYILWVLKQCFKEFGEVPVFLNGFITPDSALTKKLRDFIHPLYFGASMKKFNDLSTPYPDYVLRLLIQN